MITLIIPPGDDINRYTTMLVGEASTASRIKSRVNRLSVMGAIASTQQRLKLYNRTPTNGLVIYCGEILTEEGKGCCCWDVVGVYGLGYLEDG